MKFLLAVLFVAFSSPFSWSAVTEFLVDADKNLLIQVDFDFKDVKQLKFRNWKDTTVKLVRKEGSKNREGTFWDCQLGGQLELETKLAEYRLNCVQLEYYQPDPHGAPTYERLSMAIVYRQKGRDTPTFHLENLAYTFGEKKLKEPGEGKKQENRKLARTLLGPKKGRKIEFYKDYTLKPRGKKPKFDPSENYLDYVTYVGSSMVPLFNVDREVVFGVFSEKSKEWVEVMDGKFTVISFSTNSVRGIVRLRLYEKPGSKLMTQSTDWIHVMKHPKNLEDHTLATRKMIFERAKAAVWKE